jgi:Flp pilus assembly pilin Flp
MPTLPTTTSAEADALVADARDDRGQGLAEYALILALIAIVAIVALIFLGGQISKIISGVGGSI